MADSADKATTEKAGLSVVEPEPESSSKAPTIVVPADSDSASHARTGSKDAASEKTAAPLAPADEDYNDRTAQPSKASSLKEPVKADPNDDAGTVKEEEKAPAGPNGEDDIEYPAGFKQALLVSATMAGVFLIALDQTIVGTAIPKITDEFGGLQDVAWYGSAYFMTFGAGQPSSGKIFQFFNLKWCFLVSMLIFEVGSLLCGVAPNSNTLIVGRAIAGLGGAGMSVGGTSIITLSVPPARRPMMMGLIGTVYAVAAVLGPILGGVFSDQVSWRWCFYINLPIGGAAALAILFFFNLPAAAKPKTGPWIETVKHIDFVGFSLAMGAITSFVLALQYGGIEHPWSSSTVIGLIVGFVAISAALVGWEMWLGEYAAMLPRLYKQRSLWAASGFQFFFMGAYIVLLYFLPIFFQSVMGSSPIDSGVKNLPLMIPAAVFAIAGGIAVMATGHAMLVMLISSALTTIAIGLIYTWGVGVTDGMWIGHQVFVGTVMAFGIMHGVTVAQAGSSPEDLSAVTANILFFQTIGGAFSTAAGQSAFVNRMFAALPNTAPGVNPLMVYAAGASQLRHAFPAEVLPGILEAYSTGLRAAFAVAIAFSGLAFFFSMALPWGKLPTHGKGGQPMVMA